MTRSDHQRQQQSICASGAEAALPSSLAFVVRIEPPPHSTEQLDFKAHKRKTNEPPNVSSTSAPATEASPPPVPPRPKISLSPRRDFRPPPIPQRPEKRQTKPILRPKADATATKASPRPKSVFELVDQRFARNLYRPRSLPPTNLLAEHIPRRTHIRQDFVPFLFEKRTPGAASLSPWQLKPTNRSVVPRKAAFDTSTSKSPIGFPVGSGGSGGASGGDFVNALLGPCEQAGETESSTAMVGAIQEESTEDKMSAGSRILIKGGQVVNDDSISLVDVFVEDGIIKQVGPNLAVPGGARIIEAKGKYVFPGGIDAHTHFQLPFMGATAVDDFYAGSKAALAGGTTMIIGSVLPNGGESLLSSYEKWRGWADPKVCCDYGLSVGVTHWSDKVGEEMAQLASQKGVNSFKFFMAYKDLYMLRDEELYRAFQQCKRSGALARVHAENGDLIAMKERELVAAGVTGPEGHLQAHPEEVEIEATTRACVIARQANCPLYVLHVMSKGAADAISEARRKGGLVIGEAIAAALHTNGTHYFDKNWRHAAAFVTSPPLRLDKSTPQYLMQLLASGDLHVSASAHCAFNASQKALGKDDFTKIPHGVNGVEERMMVLWERGVNAGKMDIMRFVAVTSTNVAKIFNIYPKKGRIAEGSDADIVIWDPDMSKNLSANSHNSQLDYNIFDGLACRGIPYLTIAGGKVVFEDGQLHVAQGAGRFVPLPPNSPHVFSSIATRELACRPMKVDRDAAGTKSDHGNGATAAPPPAPSPQMQRRAEQPYMEPLMPATSRQDDFHNRPLTKAGSRNMQDSTFTISGTQIDDEQGSKKSTRVLNPPGGKSQGLW